MLQFPKNIWIFFSCIILVKLPSNGKLWGNKGLLFVRDKKYITSRQGHKWYFAVSTNKLKLLNISRVFVDPFFVFTPPGLQRASVQRSPNSPCIKTWILQKRCQTHQASWVDPIRKQSTACEWERASDMERECSCNFPQFYVSPPPQIVITSFLCPEPVSPLRSSTTGLGR